MAISINCSTSGFRIWSEALERKRVGEASDGGATTAPDVDQGVKTSDEKPHLPSLVSRAAKL